jgi:Ca2+-binding EF-hand superfamily protein
MEKTRATFALAAMMMAVGMSRPAEATALRDPTEALFSIGDKNADGKLDIDELRDLRRVRFERLDKDGDGVLSAAELEHAEARVDRAAALAKALMESGFDRLDEDGNGLVSELEFVERGPGLIAFLLDIDGDGAISRDEFDRLIRGLSQI